MTMFYLYSHKLHNYNIACMLFTFYEHLVQSAYLHFVQSGIIIYTFYAYILCNLHNYLHILCLHFVQSA